jgi:adenine-specific DNA-methyltransferase
VKKCAYFKWPILRGKDIKRDGYHFADLWLIATHNWYTNSNWKFIERIKIEDYPAVKEYLDTYDKELIKRTDQGDTPYNLRSCAYMDDFSKQKIVYSEIVRQPQFYLDTQWEFFVEATSFLMTGENIDYLIDRLNSPIIAWIFKRFYAGWWLGEDGYRYKKAFLENLPIPKSIEKNAWKNEESIYRTLELTDVEINFISSSVKSIE